MGEVRQVDYDHVSLILRDAREYGLEDEVRLWAKKYLNDGYEYVEAHLMAYNEFVK